MDEKTYEKFLDRPVDNVQNDLEDLDMLKGLEAFSNMALIVIRTRFKELPELTEEEEEALGEDDPEPIDDLHHFMRQANKFSMGARQQLEQRMFGEKDGETKK